MSKLMGDRSLRRLRWVAVALSALLILAAARGDLWGDEVWSWFYARMAKTPWEVFTGFPIDNNHVLNTFWLYLVRWQGHLYAFRLLSVACGIAAVALGGSIAARRSEREGLIATLLLGASLPLLQYFSEARGYAPAILCALGTYGLLQGAGKRPAAPTILGILLLAILGTLAHATYVLAILGFLAAGAVEALEGHEPWTQRLGRLLALHGGPLLFFAAWYLAYLSRVTIGGGDPSRIWDVVGEGASLALSLHGLPLGNLAPVVLAGLVLLAGTWMARREGDSLWALFPAVVALAPLGLFGLTHPRFFFFRYFLLAYPFFLLLLARLLARLPGVWALGAAILLALGQLPDDIRLLRQGRGSYESALRSILAQSPPGPVTIGSDHDFRNGMLVGFYLNRIPGGGRVAYLNEPYARQWPPQWYILHSTDVRERPARLYRVEGVGIYSLAEFHGFAGVSGWSWFVLRRKDPSPAGK